MIRKRREGRSAYTSRFRFIVLRSYIFVLAIPISFIILFYSLYVYENERNVLQINKNMMQSAIEEINIRIQSIESYGVSIVNNDSVRAFQGDRQGFSYPNVYQLIKTREALPDNVTDFYFINSYYLFFNNSHIVMNQEIIYAYDDFRVHYLSPDDTKAQALLEKLISGQAKNGIYPILDFTLLGKSASFLPLVYPLQDISQGSSGYLLLLVDESRLLAPLANIDIGDRGVIFMMNASGELLMERTGPKTNWDEIRALLKDAFPETVSIRGDMIVSTGLSSISTSVRLFCFQPKELVLARVNTYRFLTLLSIIATITAGFVFSYYRARKIANPLGDALWEVGYKPNKKQPAFEALRDVVYSLHSSNQDLSMLTDEYKAMLRSSFLSGLLKGSVQSEEEAQKLFRSICADQQPKMLFVLLFYLQSANANVDDSTELITLRKLMLKDSLVSMKPQILLSDVNKKCLAAVMVDQNMQESDDLYAALLELLPESMRLSLIAVGGCAVHTLLDVTRSYEQALLLIARASTNQRIHWSQSTDISGEYFLTPVQRNQLITSLFGSDINRMRETLDMILQANLTERTMAPPIRQIFLDDLLGISMQCFSQTKQYDNEKEDFIAHIEMIHQELPERQIVLLQEHFVSLYAMLQLHQANVNNEFVKEVQTYILSHLSEDISVSQVAQHFNESASRVSALFREYSEQTLARWIEQVRMTEAQRLLLASDASIAEIAQHVGFISTNSFCRAFRRFTGMNASEFRSAPRNTREI